MKTLKEFYDQEFCNELMNEMEKGLDKKELQLFKDKLQQKIDDDIIIDADTMYDETLEYIKSLVSSDSSESFSDGTPDWKLVEYWINNMKSFESNYRGQGYYFYTDNSVDSVSIDVSEILS